MKESLHSDAHVSNTSQSRSRSLLRSTALDTNPALLPSLPYGTEPPVGKKRIKINICFPFVLVILRGLDVIIGGLSLMLQ